MSHSTVKMPSLSKRLALLIFAGEGVLLLILVILILILCWKSQLDSFDRKLVANAKTLVAQMEEVDESGEEEHESRERAGREHRSESRTERSHREHDDVYALATDDGYLIESRGFDSLPDFGWSEHRQINVFSYTYKGKPYRAVTMGVSHRSGEHDSRENRDLLAFYASPMNEILSQFRFLSLSIGLLSFCFLMISAWLAHFLSSKGLMPLEELSKKLGDVEGGTLDYRLDSPIEYLELQPMQGAINLMLGRIEEAFQREKQFSADAAHELRTPIACIKSGIQANLLRGEKGGETQEVLNELLIDVERLEALCNDLLLLTSDGIKTSSEVITPKEWLNEVQAAIDSVKASTLNPKVQVLVPAKDQLPEKLCCSKEATFRIVSNLVGNAVRYGGEDVSVVVDIQVGDRQVVLTVIDDGPGIPVENQSGLFQRFYRVDKSRSREQGGFGLGLSICQSLASSFGGEIIFEPNQPTGCRFSWNVHIKH